MRTVMDGGRDGSAAAGRAAANEPRFSAMIVGGNFIGRGAEAMLMVIRDTIVSAVPGAVCCVPVGADQSGAQFEAHGFKPIAQRTRPRGIRPLHHWLARVGLRPDSFVDPARVGPGGLVNRFRCTRAVVDIAGFVSSDQLGPRAAQDRLGRYRLASAVGNRLAFMPQSWGPFEEPTVRRCTDELVARADLVFAREPQSLAHLKDLPSFDPGKVLLAPDVAFQFRAGTSDEASALLQSLGVERSGQPLVGITPNMRIVERTDGTGAGNAYVRGVVAAGRWFLDNTDARLVLIPHQKIAGRVDDPELCELVRGELNAGPRVVALTASESAARVKAVIGCLDFLVASRYHSLVAALSLRVPVAVLGWSHKYDDLMKSVGLGQWLIDPVRRASGFDLDVVVEAWRQRERLRESLVQHVPALEADSRAALDKLASLLRSVAASTRAHA